MLPLEHNCNCIRNHLETQSGLHWSCTGSTALIKVDELVKQTKFPGATDAFKIFGETQKVLFHYEKHSFFDKKLLAVKKPHSRGQYSSAFPQQPTFLTVC
ncbi:unnamed protein product [Cuscuta campestris]|uniref:Uncharacterized protein n=1 Tax=Cuscuta campestris TaxID=132261 RepID=A0A484MZ16_9ASTE|nr:unnamed protein product [Cuscuta campestris]